MTRPGVWSNDWQLASALNHCAAADRSLSSALTALSVARSVEWQSAAAGVFKEESDRIIARLLNAVGELANAHTAGAHLAVGGW